MAVPGIKVIGAQQVARNAIRAAGLNMAGARRGVYKAALFVQRTAQRQTPVKTGNLKASADTIMDALKPLATIVYSAYYAIYVHERTELHHNPPGRSKFLQAAIDEHRRDILDIIAKEMRV